MVKKYALIASLLVFLSISAYGQQQVITCKTPAGAVFVYSGYSCPPGSIRVF